MDTTSTTELLVRREGEATWLASPDVGLFTNAQHAGSLLGPGQFAGTLLAHGRQTKLLVPAGVCGRVTNERPERVHAPVGYGATLYELAPIEAGVALESEAAAEGDGSALIVPAPQTGRFYHRPSPDEPAYVDPGATVVDGQPIGLLEIMKTFSQVLYHGTGKLPARAKVVRWLVEDGAEVREGEGLLEIEAASA